MTGVTTARAPTLSRALSLATSPREVWIVRWVALDFTRRPFWCGPCRDGAEHDEMWSADRHDAWPYVSRDEALNDPDLADFWDSDDILVERIGGAS